MVSAPGSIVPVRIGNVIEFAHDADSHNVIEARVMDVDPSRPGECLVQVSPYEAFQSVDLACVGYKVVFAVGELTRITKDMIGWEIELCADDRHPERGVVKQIDSELNCALLAFDDGRKDWRDLSMNAFKVNGRLCKTLSPPSPIRATSPVRIPILQFPSHERDKCSPPIHALPAEIPASHSSDFDWFVEGSHVELCDSDGVFAEGALLCGKRDFTLQLYNEKRQFFEVEMRKQSVKVVIHGLLSLKSIPLGQSLEIYSPMHGEFRSGVVLKAAEVGKLTPVRCNSVGVEWLDLSSQTFKLLFLNPSPTRTSQQPIVVSSVEHDVPNVAKGESISVQSNPTVFMPPRAEENRASTHNSIIPPLYLDQPIEVFDHATKQHIKYRVVGMSDTNPHLYQVEQVPSASANVMAMSSLMKSMTIDVEQVRCRVVLSADIVRRCNGYLRGGRVDVYDKSDRSVLSGKIVAMREEGVGEGHQVQVKLRDGTKRWFDIQHTKMKLKFGGDGATTHLFQRHTEHANSYSPSGDSEPSFVSSTVVSDTNHSLNRQYSEKFPPNTVAGSPTGLHRIVSAPNVKLLTGPSVSTVPTLNFSQVQRRLTEQSKQPLDRDHNSDGSAPVSQERLSDMLPPMDDIWVEEDCKDEPDGIRFVHITTGAVSRSQPVWVKKTDSDRNESYIVNTHSGMIFHLPGSSSTTPQTSGRSLVLPVGPLEAVRIVTQLSDSSDASPQATMMTKDCTTEGLTTH